METLSAVLYPDEFARVIASALCFLQDEFLCLLGELRLTREDPEVAVAAAADEGILVVLVDEEDAVVGVERSEERDAQQSRGGSGLRLTLRFFGLAILDARVQHFDLAVGAQLVGGLRLLHAALEPMVVARHLVPAAEEALQVKRLDRGVVNVGSLASKGKADGRENDDDAFHEEGSLDDGLQQQLAWLIALVVQRYQIVEIGQQNTMKKVVLPKQLAVSASRLSRKKVPLQRIISSPVTNFFAKRGI